MGMFSMCPACGSDWCNGCECVKDKIKQAQQKTADEFIEKHHLQFACKKLAEALRDAMLGEIK